MELIYIQSLNNSAVDKVVSVFVEKFSVGNRANLLVGVKDNIDVAGFVTKAGSKALSGNLPAKSNASVIDRTIQAGSRIVGKLNMHELAYGMTGVNGYTGTPINYLFPGYIPGGSSSGCAVAVAQGAVDFSIGTDTGGSIRVPAACCGVFGIKPTFGRISREGILPEKSSLDCVGPMAFSASGLIEAMQVIDHSFKPIRRSNSRLRLGHVSVEADSLVLEHVAASIRNPGTDLIQTSLPSMNAAFDAAMVLMNSEMWQSFGALVDSGNLGEDVLQRLVLSKQISQEEVEAAERIRTQFTGEVDAALEGGDALVLPTLPSFPLKREQALTGANDLRISALTRPFNLSGHPALTVPIRNNLGRPMAFQLVGRKGEDAVICEIARTLTDIKFN